jgi:hypothetical protein
MRVIFATLLGNPIVLSSVNTNSLAIVGVARGACGGFTNNHAGSLVTPSHNRSRIPTMAVKVVS